MHEKSPSPQDGEPISVADVLGINYPDPSQLADLLSEDELRADISQHVEQEHELNYEIAHLESARLKVRAEMLILQEALKLVKDEG